LNSFNKCFPLSQFQSLYADHNYILNFHFYSVSIQFSKNFFISIHFVFSFLSQFWLSFYSISVNWSNTTFKSVFGINELHLKYVYILQPYFTRNQCKNMRYYWKLMIFMKVCFLFWETKIYNWDLNEVCFWNKWLHLKFIHK
jgi:hypothetical protein